MQSYNGALNESVWKRLNYLDFSWENENWEDNLKGNIDSINDK